MLRASLAAALIAGVGAAPGQAAPVRLSPESAGVRALTTTGGQAVAVVDSGISASPFELVVSSGRGRRSLGDFGLPLAQFPSAAADPRGRILVGWSRIVSGGAEVEAVQASLAGDEPFGAVFSFGQGSGPPRLAADGAGALVAFPDRLGNVALASRPFEDAGEPATPQPSAYSLTSSGPARRHLVSGLAVGPDGPLVLELAQTRALTELRVIGAGAPEAPLVAARGVRNFPAGLAADDRRIAAAYLRRGRVVLATSTAGGPWRRRTLPGPGGGSSPPSLVFAGGALIVAFEQRVAEPGSRRRYRQLYLTRLSGRRLMTRRLVRSRADDALPHAAADSKGAAYVAWTRTTRGSRERAAMLTRIR